jgi:hypothetical protein
MSESPASQDINNAWIELLESRDALAEVTDVADAGLRECLRSVRAYRLHKNRTNSEIQVDHRLVGQLINQLELLRQRC